MLPRGFLISVSEAVIKRPGRKDIALIYSEVGSRVAGVFTTNSIKAAPVRLSMERARSGLGRAVVVNSGNANACTGRRGMSDAVKTARLMAGRLGVEEDLVYVCSTGVIGVPLPMKRLAPAIDRLAEGSGSAGLEDLARAIMTTDKFPKFASRSLRLGGRVGTISAVCKGAGMIEPSMATMLCFVMSDIAVSGDALAASLGEAVDNSFNRITVDGCRSTNDTVLMFANGALGNTEITKKSRYYGKFREALCDIALELSRMVVKDGEGATKLVRIEVKGAKTDTEARKGAFSVANSALVKTALYGADPNWGRIMAALGSSGITISEDKTDISIGGVKVVSRGISTGREKSARKAMGKKEVDISIALNLGRSAASVLTCDLTEEYVRINAEYTT